MTGGFRAFWLLINIYHIIINRKPTPVFFRLQFFSLVEGRNKDHSMQGRSAPLPGRGPPSSGRPPPGSSGHSGGFAPQSGKSTGKTPGRTPRGAFHTPKVGSSHGQGSRTAGGSSKAQHTGSRRDVRDDYLMSVSVRAAWCFIVFIHCYHHHIMVRFLSKNSL